jgi:hypothetical protein
MKARDFLSSFRLLSLIIGGVVLLCAGCWEEVQYNPTEPVEETLTDATASTTELSATALFGASENPTPTADEPLQASQPSEERSPVAEATPSQFIEQEPRDPVAAIPVSVAPQEAKFLSDETKSEDFAPSEEVEITATAEPTVANVSVMRPSRTALAAWRTSSRWSLAAAIYAKEQPEDRYREILDQAAYAGDLVGIELPEFPTSDNGDLQSAVISYLLKDGSAQFADQFSAEYDPEYRALSELAIKTHTLLLVYTPKSQQLDPVVAEIRKAAENSGLPRMYWNEVVGMLERRAPFADVKQKVLAMHAEVGDYLAGDSSE